MLTKKAPIFAVLGVLFCAVVWTYFTNQSISTNDYLEVSLDTDSRFGWSVALDKNVLAVHARGPGGYRYSSDNDIIYLFEKKGSVWEQVQQISGDTVGDNNFSSDGIVSFRGATLITAGSADILNEDLLHLYSFRKSGNNWKHVHTDRVQNVRPNTSNFRAIESYFTSASLFNDMLAVGFRDSFSYPTHDSVGGVTRPDGIPAIDSVLIFKKDESDWKEVWRIASHVDDKTEGAYTEVDTESYAGFGEAVALDEGVLVVGSGRWGSTAGNKVLLFEKIDTVWDKTLEISKNDGGNGFLPVDIGKEFNGSDFGSAVALSGDILAVGMSSYGDYVDSAVEKSHGDYGAVYLFEKKGGNWKRVLKISHDDSSDLKVNLSPEDHFGFSVALFGNILAVGVPGEGEEPAGNWFGGYRKLSRGATYLFEKGEQGKWSQVLKISDKRDTEY